MTGGDLRRFELPPRPASTMDALVVPPCKATPRPWPLLVSLHGAGAKGGDPARLADEPLVRMALADPAWPWLLVCPHCPEGSGWPTVAVRELIDACLADTGADPDRVVLTGVSMGGRGVYELAYDHAARFAALVPIAAFGIPTLAPRLVGTPCWIFHGADDAVVPVDRAVEMAAALTAAGGDCRCTRLAGVGHGGSAAAAYRHPELWTWLKARRRPLRGDLE